MNWFKKTYNISSETNKPRSDTSDGSSAVAMDRKQKTIFDSVEELIAIFAAAYEGVSCEFMFEQGGYLKRDVRGWELYVPKKVVRLITHHDIDKFNEINFAFHAKNRAGEEGILLQVTERIRSCVDGAFQQGVVNGKNGTTLLQMAFFSGSQIALHNHESFREFILQLGHKGNLVHLDEKGLKNMLDKSVHMVMDIDNTSGEPIDEYRYVPLVLEIEALASPREILHGKNWREANRTNKFVHTHLPTVTRWNDLIRQYVQDERDELNTPPDILGLQHDIYRLNAPEGASSSILTFETNRKPRVMRTFMMDLLSADEKKELLILANKHRMTLTRETNQCSKGELMDVIRFYQLVKKATVNGMPCVQQS